MKDQFHRLVYRQVLVLEGLKWHEVSGSATEPKVWISSDLQCLYTKLIVSYIPKLLFPAAAQHDSEGEEEEDAPDPADKIELPDGKVGAKKLAKLQAKAERKVQIEVNIFEFTLFILSAQLIFKFLFQNFSPG